MNKFYLLALIVFILVLRSLLYTPRGTAIKPEPYIDPRYRLGTAPSMLLAHCGHPEYEHNPNYILCSTNKYYYSFDLKVNKITYVSMPLENYTVGDFILMWGTPIGFRNNIGVIRVYWHDRHIMLPNINFSPLSDANYLILEKDSESVKWSWAGFSNRETE